MYCPNCGSPVEDNQTCCTSCGKRLDHFEHETYVPYQKSRPIWFYFIVIATLILSIWGFYSLYNSGKTLETIVETQLTEIRNKQLTKSYYEYSSAEFKKNTPFEAFRTFIENNKALSNFKSIKILNSKQDNNFGVVTLELTLPDNTRIPLKYEFIKEEGEWRVLRIEIDEHKLSPEFLENEKYFEPIKTQLTAIKQHQIESAYMDWSAEDFRKNTSLEQFKQFIGKFPIISNFSKIEFLKSSLKNNQATVTIVLHEDDISLPIEYTLIHEEGKWEIWSMRIITPSLNEKAAEHENPDLLTPPIKKMLGQINAGDLKAAYEETSTGFKAVTTYEKFENFLKRFPILKNGTPTIKKQTIDHGVGKVEVELKDKKQTVLIEYTLAKENGNWIIWGIQIVKQSDNPHTDPSAKEIAFDDSFLTKEIQGFLKKIKDKELQNAYQDYTSTEFRAATSYEQFSKFIEQNTIFTEQTKTSFDAPTFDNNVGTINTQFTSADGKTINAKFDLDKEGENWKILGIKILSNQEE